MPDLLAALPGATTAGIWGLAAAILIAAIRGLPALRKIGVDADDMLHARLLARVEGLERQVDTLRTELIAHHERCERIIAEIRGQHALEMQELRERHLLELGNLVERRIERETEQ